MKECRICGESYPLEDYFKHKHTRDGRIHECRDCMNKISRDYRRSNPEINMLGRARRRARDKGLDFNLTIEDIQIPEKCPVFNIPLIINDKPHVDSSPALDRIDSSKGYIKGNVIVVSNRANFIKRDATPEELRLLADFYDNT